MSGLTASSKLLGSMIVIVTSCLVISGCNKVEDVPPRLAKGCYVIDLPGGSLVKSNIFASVGDILEPLAKTEGSTLEIKEAGDGYIVRSTFKDQLSGSEKKIAIQFDLSSQKADNSDSPIGAHCGPEVYKVSRSMIGDEEQSVIATAQMIGELVEKSSWHSEAPAKLAAAERAQQAPVNNDEDSPVAQSSPTAVDAIPEETSNQTDVNSPYSGKFNAPNKLGDLTISENNGGWTAQFSVGTENGLAADCNVTAKSTSSKSGLLSMVLLDDDQKEQPQNVFNLQFKQNGVDVVDADYGGMCGMRANLIGFYARRK